MDATSPERASLEQASLSQPLASCADIFSSSICGLLSMSGDRAVYRCFIPAFLDAHADPGENLQMVMEMTSLCSTTNPTYVHLLCTAAPGPDPPQDPSRTFYFFLSNDCLSRAGICRRVRFTPAGEACFWFAEVSNMLYRSPRGVYRDYTQDHVLPIHSFQPSQQGAICDSVPPGQSDLRLNVFQVGRITRSALDAGLTAAQARHPSRPEGALSLGFHNRVIFTEERAGPFPLLLASMLHSDFGLACWFHPGLSQSYMHSFTKGSLNGYSFTVLVTLLASGIAAPGVCLQFRHRHHGPYTGLMYRQARYTMDLSWAPTFTASDGTQRVGGSVYQGESIVVDRHFERMDWSSVADKQVAFLMGSHPRLGERSLLSTLDPAIARAIVRNCRSSSLQLDAPWSWD